MLDIPVNELVATQAALSQRQPGGGPLTMTGGRRGMAGDHVRVDLVPLLTASFCRAIPSIRKRRPFRKNKPLIVGYNRDETIFFFQQQRNTDVFNLTEASLKERLKNEFGANADVVFDTYRKSRPDASPTDLYIAITTARMIGIGAITIAERKYAQHGAPVYMYIFTHESNRLVPGTQHKMGAAHATEIPTSFT